MAKNFNVVPSVSIARSKFVRNSQHKTSFNLGEIVPVYVDEVLPGDSRNFSIAELIRMSNPIAPIMDNIYLDIYAFFVPNRLVWNHWKEFMGENNTTAGIYSGPEYTIPMAEVLPSIANSLGHHMGLPAGVSMEVSALPLRGYKMIYNTWFRDQNVEAPVTIDLGDSVASDNYNISCYTAYKKSDYFTRSLPYAQKGGAVTLPLGTLAPLKAMSQAYTLPGENGLGQDPIQFGGSALPNNSYTLGINTTLNKNLRAVPASSITATGVINQTNLYADLSQATAATINDLRFAFQYQKFLEKSAIYGSRYFETLKANFGVTVPDATVQIPEYLGHQKLFINIDQVIQTTGIDQGTPQNNKLGQVAANSVTGGSSHLFNKSFCEHGYIFVLAVARHDQTYSQGINRMWSRKHMTDFYLPVFANLGMQKVLNKEIYAGSGNDNSVFGYQEAWAEYRFKPSICSGLMDPAVSGSLAYWNLANKFDSLPTLSQSFLKQGRNALSRCLSTGSSGPDFIADFAFKDIAVRPLPTYSIPGLIDHH